MTTIINIPGNTEPHTIVEDTDYRSVKYHCAICSFIFDVGEFIPKDKLPREHIFLCPKCNGPALRGTPEQSRLLGTFIELRGQIEKLLFSRMEEAGLLKTVKG